MGDGVRFAPLRIDLGWRQPVLVAARPTISINLWFSCVNPDTAWPDVIVAAVVGGLGLAGGWRIVHQGRGELRSGRTTTVAVPAEGPACADQRKP
jgi:hypothetical protein